MALNACHWMHGIGCDIGCMTFSTWPECIADHGIGCMAEMHGRDAWQRCTAEMHGRDTWHLRHGI
eukprot:1372545-Amorphochlora_amoeboformis.AAC.1